MKELKRFCTKQGDIRCSTSSFFLGLGMLWKLPHGKKFAGWAAMDEGDIFNYRLNLWRASVASKSLKYDANPTRARQE